jgi:uncharacterized RDD family membrane protein YckC
MNFIEHLQRLAMIRTKPEPVGPRYGDIMERAVAAGIDLWVFYALFFDLFRWISTKLYAYADPALLEQARETPQVGVALVLLWKAGAVQLWFLDCVVQFLIIGVLVVGMQMIWQATPGKWIMGLKIVRRGTLAPVARWRYVLRYLAYLPSLGPLMLGMIWASFNHERRTWHDIIAGTVVHQTRPRGWYWAQVKRGGRWVLGRVRGQRAEAE